MQPDDSASIDQAVGLYVSSFKGEQNQVRQELFKFARWFGPTRALSDLQPFEIDEYGEHLGGHGAVPQAAERIKEVRKFLAFAKKEGLIDSNLAQHLKIRKGKGRARAGIPARERERIELTPQGYAQLLNELESLKARRGPIATQIQRAAADKDVRENAPLEAAREQLGFVESRIREIEEILTRAAVVEPSDQAHGQQVAVGSKVALKDLDSGRETKYMVVSASEANPLEGKISDVSPVGKALMTAVPGQHVEVETPRGKQRYRVVAVSS